MRPMVMLHAAAAIILTAFAATSATAVDRLKLLATVNTGVADQGGKEKWIEIQGWGWARTAKVDGFAVRQGAAPDDHEEEMTIVAGQVASPPGGDAKFGAVSGLHRDSSRTQAASGQAAGDPDRPIIAGNVPNASAAKRQHRPMAITKEWDASTPRLAKPLARGSVWIRVATPWAACRVGERFPAAVLQNASGSHELSDVTVAACAPDSIALNYAKVRVRAWDPKKKEAIVGDAERQ